ncbi:MAG: AI-2E family transporter [Thermodesulfovibrionales bacterium]
MPDNLNTLTKAILFLIVASLFILFLVAISEIVKLVIISALLAYVLDPFASYLESRGMNRTSATVSIFLLLLFIAGISYLIFLPVLSEEIKTLKGGFSSENAELLISRFENFIVSNVPFLSLKDLNLLNRLHMTTARLGDWIITHTLDTVSVIVNIILIPFITFFIMKDGRQLKKAFVSIVPNKYFEFSLYLFHKINVQVGKYLRGQVLDATMVGILATCAMWLLGVKYFFMIGIFAGVANLIPYFGPITGATIAVIISIFQTGSFHLALYVIIAFLIIKLIDDTIILPVVMSKSVHISPLTVLLAIMVGGKLFGILGMVLSVPFTSFIKVVGHEILTNYRRCREA